MLRRPVMIGTGAKIFYCPDHHIADRLHALGGGSFKARGDGCFGVGSTDQAPAIAEIYAHPINVNHRIVRRELSLYILHHLKLLALGEGYAPFSQRRQHRIRS